MSTVQPELVTTSDNQQFASTSNPVSTPEQTKRKRTSPLAKGIKPPPIHARHNGLNSCCPDVSLLDILIFPSPDNDEQYQLALAIRDAYRPTFVVRHETKAFCLDNSQWDPAPFPGDQRTSVGHTLDSSETLVTEKLSDYPPATHQYVMGGYVEGRDGLNEYVKGGYVPIEHPVAIDYQPQQETYADALAALASNEVITDTWVTRRVQLVERADPAKDVVKTAITQREHTYGRFDEDPEIRDDEPIDTQTEYEPKVTTKRSAKSDRTFKPDKRINASALDAENQRAAEIYNFGIRKAKCNYAFRNADVVEQVAQDFYIEVLKTADKYEEQGKLEHWLNRIWSLWHVRVMDAVIEESKFFDGLVPDSINEDDQGRSGTIFAEKAMHSAQAPKDSDVSKRVEQKDAKLMAILSPDESAIVEYWKDGKTQKETADDLGISERTVRRKQSDIREKAATIDISAAADDSAEGAEYAFVLDSIQAAATDDDEPRLLYDRKEAARQLSISVRSLDYLIANRKLKTIRLGKKVLIPRGELVKFSRANHYESVAELVA